LSKKKESIERFCCHDCGDEFPWDQVTLQSIVITANYRKKMISIMEEIYGSDYQDTYGYFVEAHDGYTEKDPLVVAQCIGCKQEITRIYNHTKQLSEKCANTRFKSAMSQMESTYKELVTKKPSKLYTIQDNVIVSEVMGEEILLQEGCKDTLMDLLRKGYKHTMRKLYTKKNGEEYLVCTTAGCGDCLICYGDIMCYSNVNPY